MKIQFVYPALVGGPIATVEDSPENCASLLSALGGSIPRRNQPEPILPTEPNRQSEEESDDDGPRRVNRRKLVLETLRALKQSGNDTPSLSQIHKRFQRLFPGENTENLDQVVRDIANKTNKLERLERGTFRLVE